MTKSYMLEHPDCMRGTRTGPLLWSDWVTAGVFLIV